MGTTKSRDFSRPPQGRRLRVALHHYESEHRQFRHVRGFGALVTVKNLREQGRLWKGIEEYIERGDWKLNAEQPEPGGDSTSVRPAGDDSGADPGRVGATP